MRVTPPVAITPPKLTSSTADAVFAPSAYSAGTTYDLGELVSVAADFRIYESLASSNLANTPSTSPLWWKACGYVETAYNAGTAYAIGATASANYRVYMSLTAANTGNAVPILPETENTNWIDVGPTNRWAMFDLTRNTQTVKDGTLTVVFAPGERINTIGLDGMVGDTLTITCTSVYGGGTVYGPVVVDLIDRDVIDHYDYCYAPFATRPAHVVFDVPPYSDVIVTVTLSSTTGNVKIGSLVVGTYIYLGDLEQGATNDGKNFSTVTRDLYGTATLVQRRTLPITRQRLILPFAYVDRALAARTLLNATPALWTGMNHASSNWFGMLQIMGIYTAFEIDANSPQHAVVNLALEEI